MAKIKNQSEHMFVEWAQGIQSDNYDVEQVAKLLSNLGKTELTGLDVGGGIGRYAQLVCEKVPGCKIVVLDKSELAEESFVLDPRLELQMADYFTFSPSKRFDFLIFKTVLHHFIADNEKETAELQRRALKKAHQLLRPGGLLLIEENFYQGLFGNGDDTPGRLIYAVTRQRWIEDIVRKLGANTAGEGVRFRAIGSWHKMLKEEGFAVRSLTRSPTWGKEWPLWQRIFLLSSGRFQGVVEAKAPQEIGDSQSANERSNPITSWLSPLAQSPIMARARQRWQNTSTRLRLCLTAVAITGPLTLSTCATSEA